MTRLQNTKLFCDEEYFFHPREREQQAIYRAYVFGQFRLFCEQKQVKEPMWRRSKAKTLLKWFLLNPGKMCSADQLIDLFWPDLPLETAFNNLHVTMHYLRRLLEPTLTSRQESKFIHRSSNNFYWFHMDATWWTDAAEVEQLFNTAKEFDRRKEHDRVFYYYRKIVGYCSSDFLPEDEDEEWLLSYRHHYKHIYTQTLMRLIQLHQQRDELTDALEYAYLALALDPYCEPALKVIIHACMLQGQRSVAIRKLDTLQQLLQSEFGILPGKELQELREKLLEASE